MKRLAALLLLICAAALAGCASSPREPAMPQPPLPEIDLERFMGRWWVIANIPYFGERGNVASADTYSLREDGRIDVVYSYRKRFDEPRERSLRAWARPLPGTGNAHWRQRFFGILSVQLHILEVDPDYQWALLGTPKRDLAWVFAREPLMDDAEYAALVERLRRFGYEPADLKRVPQVAEQQGLPGFQ